MISRTCKADCNISGTGLLMQLCKNTKITFDPQFSARKMQQLFEPMLYIENLSALHSQAQIIVYETQSSFFEGFHSVGRKEDSFLRAKKE
jgi:hypothetical protein